MVKKRPFKRTLRRGYIMSRLERRMQIARQLSMDRKKKHSQSILLQKKIEKWILIICFGIFCLCGIAALLIGEPLVILGSLLVGVAILVLSGGFDVSDLVFLIWWDIGKK